MTQIILSAKYDWRLVVLSIGIAVYAAFMAFDFGARIATEARGRRRESLWIAAGAVAMGLGIWSTQCIGMLALVLPVSVVYDVPLITVALFAAIVSSAAALFVISRKEIAESHRLAGSLFLGGGIAALHYCGMAAMQFTANRVYNWAFVALSVVIAIAGAGAALQLARLRDRRKRQLWLRIGCALVMGLTISATHYTGMAAVSFRYNQLLAAGNHAVSGPSLSITGVGLLTVAVLGLSLLGSQVERKFAVQRQMLLSEQERWLLIESASPDGLFDFDFLDGRVFYSARWKAIIGYDPDELDSTRETWRHSLYPADRQAVEENLERYLHGGQGAFEMEYRVVHRNGTARWVHARAQAVWDDHQKPIRLVGCYTDITARKKSEEQLLLSESRYRRLFEANPMPSWIYSPQDLCIQDVNQAAMDYFGWSRDAFVGKTVNSIRMPGEDDSIAETAEGLPRNTPWRLRKKNKGGIWVELTNYEIEDAAHPARLMIANDVTSHVVNEAKIARAKDKLEDLVAQKTAKLQTMEAKWEGLVENLPQMVWSLRSDGSCDYSNNQWSEFTGAPSENLSGFGWLDTIHPEDRSAVETTCLAAMPLAERFTLRCRIHNKDGSYRRVLALFVPLRPNANESIDHWLGTATESETQTPIEEDSLLNV